MGKKLYSSPNVIELACWEEFEPTITQLHSDVEGRGLTGSTRLLFRGQSNASWAVQTTLERFNSSPYSFQDYHDLMKQALPEIEAYTSDRRWRIAPASRYASWARKYDPASRGVFLSYPFMVYLRHHGFPSPLLDWSRSPNVASFFAFRSNSPSVDRCAIYVYCSDVGCGRSVGTLGPNIISLRHDVSTHRRHFIQQCEYTVCGQFTDEWHYSPHELGFSMDWNHEQDALWKITLPRSERDKVLRKLDSCNLNAYTLFSSEDALMETIAERSRYNRQSIATWPAVRLGDGTARRLVRIECNNHFEGRSPKPFWRSTRRRDKKEPTVPTIVIASGAPKKGQHILRRRIRKQQLSKKKPSIVKIRNLSTMAIIAMKLNIIGRQLRLISARLAA